MKKFKLLVTPLLVIPFIAACNNGGGDKPTEVKFSLSSDCPIKVLEDNKTAEVSVDWTPNDIIKFESFTFNATPTKPNSVAFDPTSYPRPMPVTITFDKEITEDINGTLSFAYEDVTTKSKGESSLTFTITEQRTLHFYGTNCVLKDGEGQVISTDIIVDKGTTVTYFIDGEEGFLKPKDNQIDFTYTDDPSTPFSDEHSYNPETGEVSVKLNENVTIYAASDPITPTTYDEIQIPSVDTYPTDTLHAVNGIIGIKITNATAISPTNTNFDAASCNLSDETSEITKSTPKVFSTVKMSYDQTTEESLTYDVFNEDGYIKQRLQYWSINFESTPTEDNIYIIIALNNKYKSSAGRTIKQNYTGEVSCSLYNQSDAAAGILIDYDSITEQPTL